MLSAVGFLFSIFKYCQETRIGPYQFITGNQGLIPRVITSLAYDDDQCPNSTLVLDEHRFYIITT
jgi:hypothetical protein